MNKCTNKKQSKIQVQGRSSEVCHHATEVDGLLT